MEHTNLFLYESEADFLAEYPEGKMDHPVPGVAYIRGAEGELGTLHTNREVTTYKITVHSTNKSGETVAPDKVIETNPVLDGNTVKMNVVADPVEGYKPRHEVEKVTFTSASTEHTIIYLAPTSYTVTVNYVCSGKSIAPSSAVVIDDIFDEDIVRLRIEPVTVAGYSASPVTISVSGDMTYNLDYVVSGPAYEYVDLGLPSGTLWAACNVGASSPEEYGDYFAWGEIVPNKASAYTPENYRFYNGPKNEYSKYNSNDGLTELELDDDVAHVIMGGDWHMPTADQSNELLNNTTSAWTTFNGVSGWTFTSNNNGESIFIPAAGEYWGKGLDGVGRYADVWNRTIFSNNIYSGFAFGMFIDEEGGVWDIDRFGGVSVRGVIGDGPSPEPGPISGPVMS